MSEEANKPNILIVDDTPANLNVLTAILGGQGFRVRAAPNGQGALRTAQKSPPDLILLDIQMPDMNGYEVCRTLKRMEETCHVPVIFISALDDGMAKVGAFDPGVVDYIRKPFQIEEVLARVDDQLRVQKYQLALRQAALVSSALVAGAARVAQGDPDSAAIGHDLYAQLEELNAALAPLL